MFFKIGSIKNFAIFTGKHLCWGLFLIKLQTPIQTPTEVFPVDIAKFLRIVFLYNTSGGCFWQSYHNTIKSAGVPVLWFRTSTCFRFWSKTFLIKRNVAQIIIYYHVIKQFLACLNWLVTCFRFQDIFWKNMNCFWFWWKTYTKCCTSNYVISRVKRLSSPALSGWSGAFNFRVWFGKRRNVV